MRHRTASAHRENQGEFARSGAGTTAIVRRPRDPLRVPRKIEAPSRFVANLKSSGPLANFALALLEAGFLNNADQGDLDDLVLRGLERVEQSILGEVCQVEVPALIVSSTLEGLEGYTCNEDPDPKRYWIGIEMRNEIGPVIVGEKLKALESVASGFGQTVLDVVELAGARTTGCWSPRFVREVATYTHWCGATTQEEWLDELEMYGSDPEDVGFGPGEYDGYFEVPWAIDRTQPLDPFALVQLLEAEDERVAKTAELVLEAQCLLNEGAMFTSAELTDRETMYRGVWLRWDEDDPIPQVLDDYINYANQGADCYTTLCSVWDVSTTKEGFAQWLKGYALGLKLYKTLDRLLELLSCDVTGDNNGHHQSG